MIMDFNSLASGVLETSAVCAVETRRSVSPALNATAGWHYGPAGLYFAPKVGRIEFAIEDHLINLTQFGERKVPWQELERDIRIADLIAQPPKCVTQNVVVIEGELARQPID